MIFPRKSATVDPVQEKAAQLLMTPTALADLTQDEARMIVRFMRPKRFKAGAVFIKEGEVTHSNYMMLVLSGDVRVEKDVASTEDSLVMSIIGAGSLIGEMGILDGAPRSATCTAATDLGVAVLTREALQDLIDRYPMVAARLMLAISKRLSDRLREANRKIKTLTGLSRALEQELDAAHVAMGRARSVNLGLVR